MQIPRVLFLYYIKWISASAKFQYNAISILIYNKESTVNMQIPARAISILY